MRLAIAAVIAATLLPAATATAQVCDDNSTQGDLNICADQSFRAADAKLNVTWKEIVARLKDNAPAAKLLVQAQRDWIAFRDAECTFRASATVGGSIYPMLIAECRATLTGKRVVELEDYLDCQEGDTLCPVPAAE